MNASGALLDMNKLSDVSRDVISRLTGKQVFDYLYDWSEEFDSEFPYFNRQSLRNTQ